MAGLLGVLVRATSARRILELGAGAGASALEIARVLPAGSTVISVEKDAHLGTVAREAAAAAGYGGIITVLIGDAARYLHKVAGPFDFVLQDSDPSRYRVWHEQLVALLRPGGTLVTRQLTAAADYNELLARDSRLTTAVLDIDGGVALSVKRQG